MMTKLRSALVAVAFALVGAMFLTLPPVAAQTARTPLQPQDAFALSVRQAEGGDATLEWKIAQGYYLYRGKFAAEASDGTPLALSLPEGEAYEDPYFGSEQIYRDTVRATLPVKSGPVTVHWQGCQQDGICYAPQTASLWPNGTISPGGSGSGTDDGPEAALTWSPRKSAGQTAAPTAASAGGEMVLAEEDGVIERLARRGGAPMVVLGFLGFGLLLAFTPCVFPMFPIVAGMLAQQGKTLTAGRGLVLTGVYVLAMAAAFGALGVVAAWSGANLQMALQSPWAVGVIAVLFGLLALSMFGVYDLQMPAALHQRLGAVGGRRGSVTGAAILGFTSALIVGPCVTAPLAGALLYIAQSGDVVLGAAALFALGLGQGIPLLAVGLFGARILPRSGAWMEHVKQGFGIIFLGFAIWLAGRVLPGAATLALWAALLIGTGVFLGALDRLDGKAAARERLATAAGVALVLAGALQGFGAALGATDPMRPLVPLASHAPIANVAQDADFVTVRTEDQLDRALDLGAGRPSLVYVTADWCVTCRVIERGPLSDPAVNAALADLTRIKVDVSDFNLDAKALMKRLAAAGPPTMVFLDAARTEAPGSRLVGDMGSEDMIASIGKLVP